MMNKQRIFKAALLMAVLAAVVLSLLSYLSMRRMETRFGLRDETILKIEQGKQYKDSLTFHYIDKWMQEGYISGKNK